MRDPKAAADRRKRLAIYLMAGTDAPELGAAAVAGGADLIEVGFPFSDPLADGPIIRRAAERALSRGMRTRACLDCLAEMRSRVGTVPLVPMTYAALLEAYGYERFARDARTAGATSLIVADLPIEAHPELRRVQLVAPTTPTERIRSAAERTDGWLYLVSVTGTTGPRSEVSPSLSPLIERARVVTGLPLVVGFGISSPNDAARAAATADGVVVGTRAIEVAEESGPAGLLRFVAALRDAVDSRSLGTVRAQ
jgi:tryptophan synthase alpha chain